MTEHVTIVMRDAAAQDAPGAIAIKLKGAGAELDFITDAPMLQLWMSKWRYGSDYAKRIIDLAAARDARCARPA